MMKLWRKSWVIMIMFICSESTFSQKPAVFYSSREMTASGGQPYHEIYLLNTNSASLSKTITLPVTGSYRLDLSGYAAKGTSSLYVYVDGLGKGVISISSQQTAIYSVYIPSLTSGSHKLTVQLSNFNAGANHCRVGLIYMTRTDKSLPPQNIITTQALPTTTFINANHFASKVLRGFNLSIVESLSQLTYKNIPAARATGANLGRYWITVSHDANNVYTFTNSQALTTLDSALKIAQKVGMYLIVTLRVLPEQASCDLWGTTSTAIARRNGVKKIWQQLATRYKDKRMIAAYDLINEPRINVNVAEYLRWQMELVEAIRLIDAKHVIAIEGLQNSMYAMMIPLPYTDIIYTPHSYSTLTLTHQGMTAYSGGSTTELRASYPSTSHIANYMTTSSSLGNVKIFSRRFKVPVWIGEFSCVNWAPKNSLGEWTSTRWIGDEIKMFEAEGWAWCYHSWRESQVWDPEIPSSYYTVFTYKNAAPFTSSSRPSNWSAQRTSTAPTIVMLKKWFALNNQSTLL